MARRKRYSSATANLSIEQSTGRNQKAPGTRQPLSSLFKLRRGSQHMKEHELTFVLRTLATLVDNGVPLPKALATLAQEDTLTKHREVLEKLQHNVESGVPFSDTLADFPHVFNTLMISQIRVGERAGTVVETLKQLASTRDKSLELKRSIIKKLAYPTMLVVLGSCLVAFLLMYVVPVFQETYDNAGVPLPFVTQVLIATGTIVRTYAWIFVATAIITATMVKQLRRRKKFALLMDRSILRLPLFGKWLRDIAVLQLMEVLRNLLESGFTLADALGQVAESINNRAVQAGVGDLQAAVQRGERFSREIERHKEMFPPIVNQLILVGESTGRLDSATEDICDYLRSEIERKTTLLVGAIEPILTISMAGIIAVILLAIYLPMFDMVNTVT